MSSLLDSAVEQTFPSVFVDGRKLQDAVTLIVGTTVYDAWESVSISRSLESVAGSFSVSMVDKWREGGETWPLVPSAEVLIKVGKESVINGFIDKLGVSVRNDDRTIKISGRDKTGDLVDSSAYADPSEFKNITVTQLANKFAFEIFGIKVNIEADVGKAFEKFTVKQGETVFEMLERAAKLRGLLLLSNEKGELVITNRSGGDIGAAPTISGETPSIKNLVASDTFLPKSVSKSKVSLIQGENIISATAEYNHTDRFQTYFCKGQSSGTDVFNRKSVSQVSATARDLAITRSRTLIFLADGNVDKTAAQKRVNWEAIVRATKSVDVSIKVQGWQKNDGTLWKVNELVRCEAGFIGIDADLLITGVNLIKGKSGGTMTTLKLSRPDSYDPSKKELSADSDPSATLGWKKQGISSAFETIEGLLK